MTSDKRARASLAARAGVASAGKRAPRGRPPKKVYINVLVRESTRRTMNALTKRHNLTQGELLDRVLSGDVSV